MENFISDRMLYLLSPANRGLASYWIVVLLNPMFCTYPRRKRTFSR